MVAELRKLSSNREMRSRLNSVGWMALAAVYLSAPALAAQSDSPKCTWTGLNGKPVTDLCAYAPAGAKPLSPLPVTPPPATPATQAFPFPGETPATKVPQNPAATAPP